MRLPVIKSHWVCLFPLLLSSCNLEKDIEVMLPPYESQMVVECYLQNGQPFRLTLVESNGYLDKPELLLITDATVVIAHQGVADTLKFNPFQDKATGKYYTHASGSIMHGQPGDAFTLTITDPKGRKLIGSTTVLPVVKMDTVEFRLNDKEKAFVLARFQDDAQTTNFYRFVVHKDSLQKNAEVAYASPDKLNNGQPFAFGTGYDFAKGDTVIVTLYHINQDYFDFLETVEAARDANGNPFAQPARVKSTVQGGLGIFTHLAFDRQQLVVPEK